MKGQIWSMDFIVSIMIFFLVFFLVIFVWNYTNTQTSETLELKNMQLAALQVSDSIIRQPGIPYDWTSDDVTSIGLANEENNLNVTKVIRLVDNLTYLQSRALLTGKYNYYFELLDVDGNNITERIGGVGGYSINLTAGRAPLAERVVIPVERFVIYRDQIARMKFILWI